MATGTDAGRSAQAARGAARRAGSAPRRSCSRTGGSIRRRSRAASSRRLRGPGRRLHDGRRGRSARRATRRRGRLGFYGDWLRVGIGVASDLPKSPLARSRDAVQPRRGRARHDGRRARSRPPRRDHVRRRHLRPRGGVLHRLGGGRAADPVRRRLRRSTELGPRGAASSGPTARCSRTPGVVVAARERAAVRGGDVVAPGRDRRSRPSSPRPSGRVIDELDGRPAASRLRELVAELGGTLDEARPSYSFARYVDGMPYVRSMPRHRGRASSTSRARSSPATCCA